jgi:hypothetical protein
LADIGFVTFANEVGAVVVDLLSLLHLRGDRTAALRAREQPYERVQPLPRAPRPVPMKDRLHGIEPRHDRFVRALEFRAAT